MMKKRQLKRENKTREGQAMIMTVMLISSAVLGATVLAALLVLFQLRQTSDVKSSTQAIFAADSGIECALYERLSAIAASTTPDYTNCGEMPAQVNLDNGAYYTVIDNGSTVKSIGRSERSTRAFEITF